MILAGDIGGTKTHLALFDPSGGPRAPLIDRKFPTRDHPSLEAVAHAFLDGSGAVPDRAVFGIAGPVKDNRCEATNLPWNVDGAAVGVSLGGARVTLLNDLEATAWGLPILDAEDLEILQHGKYARGNRALIAAGTGLGEAIVVPDGERWLPLASEGGHADFGSRDPLEDELLGWLRARYGRASYERVLSGPGLADLYRFFSETGRGHESEDVAKRFATAPDPAVVVTQAGLDGLNERARLVIEKFLEIYGAEAGNLALKAFAVGGVFVGGGIAPRMLEVLRDGRFVRAFSAKGRLSALLATIPVHLILDPRAALWGAAHYAMLNP